MRPSADAPAEGSSPPVEGSGRGAGLLGRISSPTGALLVLTLLVAATYLPSIHNAFVGGDDDVLLGSPSLHLPWSRLPSLFATPLGDFNAAYYRPVLALSLWVTHALSGEDPLGFRVFTLLQHLLATTLLYRCGRLLFRDEPLVALLAAALFAVHPVNTEPAARALTTEGLLGVLIVTTLLLYLKGARKLSLAAFALAVFTKEPAVLFPVALAVLAVGRRGARRGLVEVLPYAAVAALFLAARFAVVGPTPGVVGALSWDWIRIMAAAAVDYLRLLIVPYPLHPFYPAIAPPSPLDPRVLLAVAVLGGIVLLLYRVRRQPDLLFLAALALVMLAPAIYEANCFVWGPDRVYLSERYLYVPAMSFSLLAAVAVLRAAGRARARWVAAGWAVPVAAFSAITISASGAWRDEETLHRTIVRDRPEAVFAHNNLGVALVKQKRLEEAIEELRVSARLKPDQTSVYFNIGVVRSMQGRYPEAIDAFDRALAIDPGNADAWVSLGSACLNGGRIDDAIRAYQAALRLDARNAQADAYLGIAYRRKARSEEAAKERSSREGR